MSQKCDLAKPLNEVKRTEIGNTTGKGKKRKKYWQGTSLLNLIKINHSDSFDP
jgi:hypothetical protein